MLNLLKSMIRLFEINKSNFADFVIHDYYSKCLFVCFQFVSSGLVRISSY